MANHEYSAKLFYILKDMSKDIDVGISNIIRFLLLQFLF